MSLDKLRRQGELGLYQANDDAESATLLLEAGKFATSGFLFQQAAEKAVKALSFALDADPRGHSVSNLIAELPAESGSELQAEITAARRLDKLYIPTRYPDALPDHALRKRTRCRSRPRERERHCVAASRDDAA